MSSNEIIDWLLNGDVSIQYQVWRDLLGKEQKDLQNRISSEGWGKEFLSRRKSNGHWGDRFYQPKWISTHYTLLDLRNLNLAPTHPVPTETINSVLQNNRADDGGIRLGPSTSQRSDVCVNGMFLNYASYFNTPEIQLHSVIDSILGEWMPDGGFNCWSTRVGAKHSSLHSTLSVLEGFYEFLKAGNQYRKKDIKQAQNSAEEFILMHKLFRSDKTGNIINKDFLKLVYPSRWKYDILRALDYFQYSRRAYDNRMEETIEVLLKKRNKTGGWNVQSAHSGQVHFEMEKAGQPSRWNTLRVLRVIHAYKPSIFKNL